MKLLPAVVAIMLPVVAATAAPEAEEKAPATAVAKPTTVDANKLKALLPEPPKGWKAERAETQSSGPEDEIHISTARRSYYTGEADDAPVAAITIIDSTNNADYFDADEEGQWEKESKTDDGYDKRSVHEGMKVIEHYSKQAATGSLSVFVGNRYFVQIELTNDDPAKLYDWLKRIDVAQLAALK